MKPLCIQIINGPNLNVLGKREPSVYGSVSFEEYLESLRKQYPSIRFLYYQSNIEGELIDRLQRVAEDKSIKGVVLNAGAYTHTSIGIGDAISEVPVPVVEVHISNVFNREKFRHVSHLSAVCVGSIVGFGLHSYTLAVEALLEKNKE